MIRTARSRSFVLVVCRSIMRLPRTLPSPIIAPVLIILSATFVAVPAFNLVDPARISGPTGSAITKSLIVAGVGDPGWPAPAPAATDGLQVSKITFAPSDLARASAPRTKGVRPLAVIPITTSAGFTPRSEEHTSELQSLRHLVCRLLLE